MTAGALFKKAIAIGTAFAGGLREGLRFRLEREAG